MFWVPGERTPPFCTDKCSQAHHERVRAQRVKAKMVKRGLAEPAKAKTQFGGIPGRGVVRVRK